MNKLFTFALATAFATTSAVQAQVLKYGAEAGETAPDTVNWYGNWIDAGGQLELNNQDEPATGSAAIYVNTPEAAGAAQDWERVLKFDGLQIKPNTSYRVRLAVKAEENATVGLALMCGDENCDMPFVLPTANGYVSQKKDITGFDPVEYKTVSAIFRYTTDEYQQQIYPSIKADDKNPLGANRFLRLTVKSIGEYYMDDVVVEEAPIAACYNNVEAIKVDFGFKTNIADLVKANGGTITLDKSCAKITIDGEDVNIMSVELNADGNLYIYPDVEEIDASAVITVSFDATNSGITYVGTDTPGDGVAVPSFTNECSFLDNTSEFAASVLWEEPKLVSSTPKDTSFELDEDIDEFTFTFNKDIYLTGSKAPYATIIGGSFKKPVELDIKKEENELGRTVTFYNNNGKLTKGKYYITIDGVTNYNGFDDVPNTQPITIMIETGKVSVAEIEYTDVEAIDVQGTNGNHSENWTSYFDGAEVVPAGSGIRMFEFPESGAYKKGFYLSQRDAGELGTALSYGEKEDAPLNLPDGDVQVNILVSAWQGNSGNFLYELLNEAGEVVVSGNGTADVHQKDQGTPANEISKVSFNVENCEEGKYVLRLTTKSGGYGNAIIVWGLDIKTYEVGQGETGDPIIIADGSFAGIVNDGAPDQGSGWTIYELKDGVPTPIQKGAGTGIGQRARVFTFANIPTMPAVYYNRNMGGNAETSYYMTFGDTSEAAGEEPLYLDEERYNFSWYAANWKGTGNKYSFQIIDVENDNAIVYSREDMIDVNVNGSRDAAIEPVKIDFAWTAPHYGQYMLKWFMEGESMVGNIKVEQMGSMAVYWHTQLNNAVKAAEAELAAAEGEQFAGPTRDALEGAIKEAKTVTYHTGEEYTEAMNRLEKYVKDMASRRKSLSDYDTAYGNLVNQVGSMTSTKYEKLASYKTAADYVEKYNGVEGYTIANDELLPLVEDMKTLYTLNTNLMASNTGVDVLTDQVRKLAAEYVKIDQIVNGEESIAEVDEFVDQAENEVTDNQNLAAVLKKMVTSALYKAIDKGYDFTDLEFPEDPESEDNPRIPSALDLSGFIRNSVFYTNTPIDVPQPATQEAANGTCPGWEFNAPNGYAADWGWGGWTAPNQPAAPMNIANSQPGTRYATDFELWQTIAELPVGIYSIGADCCDRSYVGASNTLEGGETPSTLYVKQEGQEDLTTPFKVDNIGTYYGLTETLIEEVQVNPAEGANTGKVTLGANVIFFGQETVLNEKGEDIKGGFAGIDNAKIKMSAKHPTFNYAAAAAELDKEIESMQTSVKAVDTAASVVKTQYFDMNGRKVAKAANGIFVRIDTMSDGTQRAAKVLRK